MTYEEIREAINAPKRTRTDKKMHVVNYGHFSVMYSDKVSGIIVDADMAEGFALRRWCIDSGGYPVANINGNTVRLFDAVLALRNVRKPKGTYVDHINLDKLDNRYNNLRIVSPTTNAINTPRRANNKTGVTGVCADGERFRAYITINKKRIELGSFRTLDEAAKARNIAESKYGFYSRPPVMERMQEAFLRTERSK